MRMSIIKSERERELTKEMKSRGGKKQLKNEFFRPYQKGVSDIIAHRLKCITKYAKR